MGQVIQFKRDAEDAKAKAVEAIEQDMNELQIFISFPKGDEGDIFFLSNFDPGVRELTAIETVLSFLTNQHFTVEMET